MKFWQCIWIETEIGKNDEKLENFLKLGRYWVKLTHLQNEVCGISSTSGYISLSWNQLLNALGCQEKKLNLIRAYFGQFRSTRNSIITSSHFTWIIYMYCYMGRHNWSSYVRCQVINLLRALTTRFLPLPNVLGVMVLLKKIGNEYLGYFHIISPPGYSLDWRNDRYFTQNRGCKGVSCQSMAHFYSYFALLSDLFGWFCIILNSFIHCLPDDWKKNCLVCKYRANYEKLQLKMRS